MEMYAEWTCMVNVDVLSESEKLKEMIYIYIIILYNAICSYAMLCTILQNKIE